MEEQKELEKISKRLFPQLKNTERERPQLIIVFSGVPGSGKSVLSKKLEEKYSGVKIGNDSIRDIINHSGDFSFSKEEGEKLLQNYNEFVLRNYPFKNKFLILDKSMDRQYKRFFPIFEELGLKYFVIRMDINKEEAIERIMTRKGEDFDLVKKSMERWKREFEEFGKNSHYDIVLDGKKPDFEKVCSGIEKLISPNT